MALNTLKCDHLIPLGLKGSILSLSDITDNDDNGQRWFCAITVHNEKWYKC